jgi:hypothetical protein
MKRGPRLHRARYDKDGVPIDGCDWDAEDYQILWEAMQAARAKIAERHKERRLTAANAAGE